MARAKKAPRVLPDSEKRLSGLKSIDPKLNFGGGISAVSFENKIERLREKLEAYNGLLSEVDAIYDEVLTAEEELSALSSKLLAGVGMRYGKDSSEYERAGGSRQGERRRRRPTASKATANQKKVAANQPKVAANSRSNAVVMPAVESSILEAAAQLN